MVHISRYGLRDHDRRWRIARWSMAALLLLTPLFTMRMTDAVNWTGLDFAVAAALIGMIGLGYELAVRLTADRSYRAGAAVALTSAFVLIWVTLAVGYIGDTANPANLIVIGVIAIAVGGTALSRGVAPVIARVMLGTAAAQAISGAIAAAIDPPTLIPSIGFVLLWLAAAALFQRSAARTRTGAARPC